MSDHIILALDAMGGDMGASAVVPGAAQALAELPPNVRFLLVGNEAKISPLLNQYAELKSRADILHTPDSISNEIKPSVALRQGRNSSMRLALNAVAEGRAHAAVSSGNTGALMAMAKFTLKTLPGIHRPAIASVFPTMRGETIMLDLGANIGCTAENLVQFAVLGAVFGRTVKGWDKPTVGLLNVGSEEMKGSDSVRNAYAILNDIEFPGVFHGYIEGNDIPHGTTDVVVTDGFTGNICLKLAEGMGTMTGRMVKDAFNASPLAKLGGLLALPAMKKMKKKMDPRAYNGGMFLGLGGICVKSHGSSDAYGFSRAVIVAAKLVKDGYNDRVAAEIQSVSEQECFFSDETAAGGVL